MLASCYGQLPDKMGLSNRVSTNYVILFRTYEISDEIMRFRFGRKYQTYVMLKTLIVFELFDQLLNLKI